MASSPDEAVQIQIQVERDVPVRMRDGVVLRADVYRPAEGGPYPVLVVRTPYGKRGFRPASRVQAGYIVVCQDVRGPVRLGRDVRVVPPPADA
jgi:predicted acyl esterase